MSEQHSARSVSVLGLGPMGQAMVRAFLAAGVEVTVWNRSPAKVDAMVALGLADEILLEKGAVRIHGGGFGGTIQAFVPLDMVDDFVRGMDAAFGQGASGVYGIDHEGVSALWL